MDRFENAHQKLDAAAVLLKEGFFEDSISRSYYAMYHAAQALLESKDVDVKTHSGLIRMIGKEFVKPGQLRESLGKALSIAEEDRELADYDLTIDFSEEEARERLEDARDFVSHAEEIIDG